MTHVESLNIIIGYTRGLPASMGALDRERYYAAISALVQPYIDTLSAGSELDYWTGIQTQANTLSGFAAAEAAINAAFPQPESLEPAD